jgi:hypothetical protein
MAANKSGHTILMPPCRRRLAASTAR